VIRWRAKNPSGTHEYYVEPYTVQHFTDWLVDMPKRIASFVWFAARHFTSKKFRMENARAYNRALFGGIPTSQIYISDGQGVRPLREEERTWPE
jgi:hypothetical protein